MFALATLVFAACSDDHAISDGNSDVVTDPSGDAWVALNIKTPAAVTRGLNTPNQENAITSDFLRWRSRCESSYKSDRPKYRLR